MEEKETRSSSSPLAGQPRESTNGIVKLAQAVVGNKTFDWIITGVILLQALALALKATPAVVSVSGKDDEILDY